MIKVYLDKLFYVIFLLVFMHISINAKGTVECAMGTAPECNPYGGKLMYAKQMYHDRDRKKLIVQNTFSLPQKPKSISVADMIEKYVKIEDSLRFKRTYHHPLELEVEDKSIDKKIIQDIVESIDTARQDKEDFVDKKVKINKSPIEKVIAKEKVYGAYKVVSGDFLGKIASKFGLSIKELSTLNDFNKTQTLKLGQNFKIPLSQKMVDSISDAEYSIESGDTLNTIAYQFKLEPNQLAKFNHISPNEILRVAKKLKLPLPYILKKIEAEKKVLLAKKKLVKRQKEVKKKLLRKQKEVKKRSKLVKKNKKIKFIRGFGKRKLRVTATAYSSHSGQTDSTPFLAAWNNRLRPGMKIIAVSRDMLTRYGMRNGTRVRIGGLRGYYTVRDKMNKRYKKRIDIYMGLDRRRALRWGRRSVTIYY